MMIKGRPYSSNARDIAGKKVKEKKEKRESFSFFCFPSFFGKSDRQNWESSGLDDDALSLLSLSLSLFTFFSFFLSWSWRATEESSPLAAAASRSPRHRRMLQGRRATRRTSSSGSSRNRSRSADQLATPSSTLRPIARLVLLPLSAPPCLYGGPSACC